jgi:hypothetical protein
MKRFGRGRSGPSKPAKSQEEIDQLVRRLKGESQHDGNYRERSLALHGWICAKCGREFERHNLALLTVHHKDGNHHNNRPTAATGRIVVLAVMTMSTAARCSATISPVGSRANPKHRQ